MLLKYVKLYEYDFRIYKYVYVCIDIYNVKFKRKVKQ